MESRIQTANFLVFLAICYKDSNPQLLIKVTISLRHILTKQMSSSCKVSSPRLIGSTCSQCATSSTTINPSSRPLVRSLSSATRAMLIFVDASSPSSLDIRHTRLASKQKTMTIQPGAKASTSSLKACAHLKTSPTRTVIIRAVKMNGRLAYGLPRTECNTTAVDLSKSAGTTTMANSLQPLLAMLQYFSKSLISSLLTAIQRSSQPFGST